jgi:hypothetical protein
MRKILRSILLSFWVALFSVIDMILKYPVFINKIEKYSGNFPN